METLGKGIISRLFGSHRPRPAVSEPVIKHSPVLPVAEDVLRSMTPHTLAVAMLQLVMEGDSQWRQANPAATSEAHAKFPMACECYQLSIFMDLLTQRFGKGVSSIFEASLNAIMDVDSKIRLFPSFRNAIARARQLGPAEIGPDEPKLKMDWQVAQQLLNIVAETQESKQALLPSLAESLSYARIWAETTYPGVITGIEFDPMSIVMVQPETAYKGITDRWREAPGCFERQLQRMEGNLLFPEDCRNPTDEAIRTAREKDDDELKQLDSDVQKLFRDFKALDAGDQIQASVVLDYMQYRVEPLMVRAAEVGERPATQRYISTLKALILSCLDTLKESAGPAGIDLSVESFEPTWRYKTNTFIAQRDREDTPIDKPVPALLCESTETIETVLNVYREQSPELAESLCKVAHLHLELAELDGFELPGKEEKLTLFDAAID